MEILEKVEQLKTELDSLRPLDGEAEARIMQKFRLDWNYHSNKLEGNSLTYGETKALILFGVTAQGKPLKDHFEITGHNEAINWIMDIVKDERPLTETFIRELHTLLLKESSFKDAVTLEGKPTRRKIEVGKYKTQPNYVITVTGETFYYTSPEETPAKMQELIEWFRKEKENSDVNPVILASLFHYRFIRIHPFDDGNGRVARILMNFILMQFGYPPVIIKTEDKENYYAVLRLADSDQLEPFIEYIAENLERSLEIMIRGARGEDIEEPEDLDKELALLEREFRGIGRRISVVKDEKVMGDLYKKSFIPIANKFIETNLKFSQFYASKNFSVSINESKTFDDQSSTFLPSQRQAFLGQFRTASRANLHYAFYALSQDGLEHYDYSNTIRFDFDLTKYKLVVAASNNEPVHELEKLYSEGIEETDIAEIMRIIANKHKLFIKTKLTEIQNIEGLQRHLGSSE
jgi:Fic family protein